MKLSEEISQKRWNFGWNFRENDELVIDDTLDFLKRFAARALMLGTGYTSSQAIALIKEKRSPACLCNLSFLEWLQNADPIVYSIPDIPTNDEEAIAARFDHPWDTALCG